MTAAGSSRVSRVSSGRAHEPSPLLYTGQDLARFCEVDLKTVHHWADRGKVVHYRTEGRHLRFRRNDVVRFLRSHDYPIPDELAGARPALSLALPVPEEIEKKLASRFTVTTFETAIAAIARLTGDQPDAIVLSLDDPTFSGIAALLALKTDQATAWVTLVVVAADPLHSAARDAGAEFAIAPAEIADLPKRLAQLMALG